MKLKGRKVRLSEKIKPLHSYFPSIPNGTLRKPRDYITIAPIIPGIRYCTVSDTHGLNHILASSYNLNTPACNASGSQTFHPKLCEASSVLPLMKPHKVWGETFGYQKRYRLVCRDCMKNDDPARIPKELYLSFLTFFN